ncbi:MAG: hypothetical protein ACI4C1_10895 [Lachnospiraceae bacterium]
MNMNWNQNPIFQNMEPVKAQFLQQMLTQASAKQQSEILPFLLTVTATASSRGIHFNDQETDFIVEQITSSMSPAEKKKVALLRKMTQQYSARNSTNKT